MPTVPEASVKTLLDSAKVGESERKTPSAKEGRITLYTSVNELVGMEIMNNLWYNTLLTAAGWFHRIGKADRQTRHC